MFWFGFCRSYENVNQLISCLEMFVWVTNLDLLYIIYALATFYLQMKFPSESTKIRGLFIAIAATG